MRFCLAAALAACLASVAPAMADALRAGDLVITNLWVRGTPPGAAVSAGYVQIENTGTVDDTLVSASAPGVGRVELHRMAMADGVMSMAEVAGGIAIPAGESVTLQPGGLHIMFMALADGMTPDTTVPVTLTFRQAGTVTIEAPVSAVGARAYPAD